MAFERLIEVDGIKYSAEDINRMSLSALKQLVGFAEKIGDLMFIQNSTNIEAAKVYIDNLTFSLPF